MDAATATATTATAGEGETLTATPKYTYKLGRTMRNEIRAETEIPLPQLDAIAPKDDSTSFRGEQKHILTLSTCKAYRGGGIETRASVSKHGEGFRTMDIFGDFSRGVARSPSRGTEKAIRALHEQALREVAALLPAIDAHYATKWAKAAAEKARFNADAEARS